MHKHSHKGKDRKRKERYRSREEGSSGVEDSSFSGDCSAESKEKRRRRTKTHAQFAHEKGHHRQHSKHSSSGRSESVRKGRHTVLETISSEDYFKRSAEFRAWLSEKRGLTFSDLNSEESRKMFNKFVRHWNAGKLDEGYYKGVATADLMRGSQTRHQWKMHSVHEDELSRVAHKVGHWTNDSCAGLGQGTSHDEVKQGLIGPTLPFTVQSGQKIDGTEEEDTKDRERRKLQLERKAFQKDHEMVLEELLPRETGRERHIEKKKIRSEMQKERDVSPELKDSFSTEASGCDIKARLQKIKDERERRSHAAKDKVSEYQAKERARAQAIMELAKASKKEGSLWR